LDKSEKLHSCSRWVILFIAFLAAFAFIFSMQAMPPLMSAIMEEYHITHATASLLILVVALPAVFLSIPGGVFVDKYGVKKLGSIGLFLICIGGLVSAFSTSYMFLIIGRTVIGLGGAITFVSAFTLVAQTFSMGERGLAMGIFGLNMPLATIISFNILGRIEFAYTWRSSLFIPLMTSVVVFFIWIVFITERPVSLKENRSQFSFSGLRNLQIWILGFIWASFNMAAISFTTWGPKLFEDFWGMLSTHSNFLASLLMFGALVTPLTGYVSDRLGKHRLLIVIPSVGMAISFFLIPALSGEGLFLLVVFLGLISAFIPPAVFALPPEILDKNSVGLGYGVLNTCLNVGVIVGPLIVGVVIDITHSVMIIFSTMTVFAILTVLLAFGLKVKTLKS
jgi:MFS family permease